MKENTPLVPIKKWHSNVSFHAPEGMDNCSTLEVTRIGDQLISVWKIESFWERVKFVFSGEISLTIFSRSLPPVSLVVGDCVYKSDEVRS